MPVSWRQGVWGNLIFQDQVLQITFSSLKPETNIPDRLSEHSSPTSSLHVKTEKKSVFEKQEKSVPSFICKVAWS